MKKIFLNLIILAMLSISGFGQNNPTYMEPFQSIVELVDAPATPEVKFNSDGSLMLILEVPGYTTIEQVAQPVIGLAGLRINPANNSTEAERAGVFTGIKIKNVKSGKERELKGLPQGVRIDNITWGPDGQYFSFSNNGLEGLELWVANVESMEARRLTDGYLNDAFGETLQWHPDGKHILAQFIPSERGAPPVKSIVPSGPIIQENLGEVTPARTYQNLLQNSFDEGLMEYYLVSQLKAVDIEGTATNIGAPALYRNSSYSPDGNYLMVQVIKKPYSYIVPIYYFSYETSILKPKGELVNTLFKAPLADELPTGFQAVAMGPRSYEWRADQPATLVWVEAQDGGDPEVKAEFRDALFSLDSPFTGEASKLLSTELRYRDLDWINEDYAIVRETWRKTRSTKMRLFNPDNGEIIKVLSERSSEDVYSDPGDFVAGEGPYSKKVLLSDSKRSPVVFTVGNGASPEGDRPFLMKWDLLSGKKDTLFKSEAPYFEVPVFFNNKGSVNISRESNEETPNFLVLNLKNDKEKAITAFADPYPSLKGVQKELISYSRKDSINLSAMLYLPKNFSKGEDAPLPVLIWAYPREYKTREAAGQLKGSPFRYTRLDFRSPVYWVTRGYAVLDNAAMPIIGEADKQPNDTFIEQLKDNATAIIEYVVDRGIADRNRIGIGGHSYGAFMTANLLAHTDLFAAGIARSGAYNRTLTPFGFQAEPRTFWEAPEVYSTMSPFNHADKLKTPLLITHGMDDENSGTFPVQSERLYGAIKGHGGTVRLVMFPKEFHGYRSRESVLHTFWEQDRWLETYVKNRDTIKNISENALDTSKSAQ